MDRELRSTIERLERDLRELQQRTANMPVRFAGGASGGGNLPAGSGQYKVLQLDGSDQPVWDWVRAH